MMKKIVMIILMVVLLVVLVYYGSKKSVNTIVDDEMNINTITNEYRISIFYDRELNQTLHENIQNSLKEFPYEVINTFCEEGWTIKITENPDDPIDTDRKVISVKSESTIEDTLSNFKLTMCQYAYQIYEKETSSSEYQKLFEKYKGDQEDSQAYFIRSLLKYVEAPETQRQEEKEIYDYFNYITQ